MNDCGDPSTAIGMSKVEWRRMVDGTAGNEDAWL